MKRRSLLIAGGSGVGHLAFLGGCAAPAARPAASARGDAADLALLNRVTWGINSAAMAEWGRLSRRDYLQAQLHPAANARLPAGAQAQIDALSLFQKTMPAWVVDMEQRRRDADALANDDARKTAQQAYQQDLNQAGTRCGYADAVARPVLARPAARTAHVVLVQPLQCAPVQVQPARDGRSTVNGLELAGRQASELGKANRQSPGSRRRPWYGGVPSSDKLLLGEPGQFPALDAMRGGRHGRIKLMALAAAGTHAAQRFSQLTQCPPC